MKEKKHQGKIVEKALRNSGFKITNIAVAMKVNRSQIYRYFRSEEIDHKTLFKLGQAIGYDFVEDLPELCISKSYIEAEKSLGGKHYQKNKRVANMQKRYYRTKEAYHKLRDFLVEMLAKSELDEVKKEVDQFFKEQESKEHLK